jgi:uncharacterized membrane protein
MTREHPFHLAMKIRQEKINKDSARYVADNEQSKRMSVYSGTNNFGQIQDLKKSDFFKRTKEVLDNNLKKQTIQRKLNSKIDNMSKDELTNFNNLLKKV